MVVEATGNAVDDGQERLLRHLAEIVASLAKAEREGGLASRIRFMARNALLIVEEIGHLSIQHKGANLFSQLVTAGYEKAP